MCWDENVSCFIISKKVYDFPCDISNLNPLLISSQKGQLSSQNNIWKGEEFYQVLSEVPKFNWC